MGNILEAAIPTEEERDRTLRPLRFSWHGDVCRLALLHAYS